MSRYDYPITQDPEEPEPPGQAHCPKCGAFLTVEPNHCGEVPIPESLTIEWSEDGGMEIVEESLEFEKVYGWLCKRCGSLWDEVT